MKLQPVKSSLIAAVGHDPEKKLLRIQFPPRKGEQTGITYEYANVDSDTHQALVTAESVGRAFGALIKPDPKRFPFRKLTEEEAAQ